jgi:hypothetical protein
MGMYLKNSSGWKNLKELYVKTSTGWKQIKTAYLKNSTGWKLLFSSSITPSIESGVLISKATNATTKLITLTGKNFHWFNSTGITYRFMYSSDGVSFYNLTSATTISNPSVGSNNTVTYNLSTSDVQPNVDNVYKFIVTATNSTYDTATASEDSLTIPGIRDITGLTNDAQGYTSLDFSWNGGTYSNGFIYEYQEYIGGVGGTWSGAYATENYFVTISSLSPDTTYRIRVKGITGTTTANPGYSGNWAYQTGTTENPPTPNVTSYPTISGTAVAKTIVTSGNGSYSNYSSGIAVQSRIIAITNPALIVQGDTAPQGSVVSVNVGNSSQTYTVTQADATNKSYYFFARDTVFALDGVTAYYYYSTGIKSSMGTVTDNFDRTVAGGIGTMSSEFTYSGPSTAPAWSVNGSWGQTAAAPTATSGPNTWGLRSIEMGGNTDISMSVRTPSNEGGVGLAFWVTSSSNWWSANCYKAPSITTQYNCTGAQQSSTTDPGAEGTGSGDRCNKISSVTYECNQAGGSSTTDPGAEGTGSGAICSKSSATGYACDQFGGSGSSFPSNVGTGSGQNCNVVSVITYECNQPGGFNDPNDPGSEGSGSGAICNKSSSTVYPCETNSATSSQTNPGDPSSAAGGVCNKSVATSYQFTSTIGSTPPGSSASSCTFANVGKYQSGSLSYNGFYYTFNICSSVTIYTWSNRSNTATTLYSWSTRATSGTTTYYWNKRSTTAITSYAWNTRSTTGTTTYYWNTREAATTTIYGTYLRIYEANGSSVTMKNSNEIDGSSIGYLDVYKINLSTSGNTITASLRNTSDVILGTATEYVASSPTKSDIFGSSGFGLSKGYSIAVDGNSFDDLTIS